MFELIKKDFYSAYYYLLGPLVGIPFVTSVAVIAMTNDFGGIIISVFTMLIIILCLGNSFLLVIVEGDSAVEITYASLPLKRQTIVFARYLSFIIFNVLAYGLVILTCKITVHWLSRADFILQNLLSLPGSLGMLLFLILVQVMFLPFLFKYGPGKGIVIALITQMVLFLSYPVLKLITQAIAGIWYFDIVYLNRVLKELLLWLIGLQAPEVYLFAASLLLFSILTSMKISAFFYNRRDL